MSLQGKRAQEHLRLAWEAADKNDLEAALREIDISLELRPGQTLYWATKGAFLREMARLEESEQALRKAVELDQRNSTAWVELAQLHQTTGAFEKAAFCLERSVEIKPDFHTYTMLANVQLTFDPRSALGNANKALALNAGWEEAKVIRESAEKRMESEPADDGQEPPVS